MARTETRGTTGAKRSSSGSKKTEQPQTSTGKTATGTAGASAPLAAAPTQTPAPARPFAAERGQPPRPATTSKAKDPLQASIERQSQLQLMIRTQNSARAWARNVRQMQVVLLFVWFGFWTFLEAFLDIGHRVTHAWGLQSHRSAKHDVLVLDGALVEGLFSATIAIGVGLAIYKGVQKAVKA